MRKLLPFFKISFSVLCLVLSSFFSLSQTYLSLPNISTPSATALGRYGAFPVSYYTGALNVGVPLYVLNDKDVPVDISLQYDASGFIPNEEAGEVGLKWSLFAGGVITRSVNWEADDKYSFSGTLLNTNKGYIYGMLNSGLGTYSKTYIRDLGFLSFSGTTPSTALQYEYSPDIFTFNFNGHRGRFFLGNDGTVKVSSDRNYKVNLTGLSGQTELCQCQTSTISITTDEGDIYTFGGDINTLQISYPYPDPNEKGISCSGAAINAWYLKSIQTRNGKTITYNYESQSKNVFTQTDNIHGLNSSVDYAYEKIFLNEKLETYFNGFGQVTTNTTGTKFRSLIKTVYLSNITTDNAVIEFLYSIKPYGIYGSSEIIKNPNKSKQLDKIRIKDAGGSTLKNISFLYDYYGSSTMGYRQFLTKVNFTDASDNVSHFYQLDYYKTSQLPYPLTKGLDIWGYYNGNDGNTNLIPYVNSGAPNYDVTFTNRGAGGSYCDVGLLKRITYPTKGWSEFVYENHDYSKVLRKSVASGLNPTWVTENGNVGGARIKQITNSEGMVRNFFYKKDYDPSGSNPTSSGLLTDHNIFYLDLQFYFNSSWPNVRNAVIQDNNIASSSSFSESPIAYSEVTEVVGEGYTKYFYSTKETNPDIYTQGTNSYKFTPTSDNSFTNYTQQQKRLNKYSSCDLERGKLLRTAYYNSSRTLVKEVLNQYNTDAGRYDESVIGFNFPYESSGWGYYHSYALYYFQNNLTQTIIKEYPSNGVPIITTTNYQYISNSNPLLLQQSTTTSKNETKLRKFRYPKDFVSSPDPANVYQLMLNSNRISNVVEQTDAVVKGSTEYVTRSVLLPYRSYGSNKFYNDETYELDIPNQVPISDKQGTLYKYGGELSFDSRYSLTNRLYYDANGNVSTAAPKDKKQTAYLWNYNGSLPVAKVVNASNIYESGVSGNTPIQASFSGLLSQTMYVTYNYNNINVRNSGSLTLTFGYGNPYISGNNSSILSFTLTGVSVSYTQSSSVCAKTNYYPSGCTNNSYTFTGLPAGTYNLSVIIVSVTGFQNYYGYYVDVNYDTYRDKVVQKNSAIAFTSFETSEHGNWNDVITGNIQSGSCPTGKKYYTLSSVQPITINGLSSSVKYIVSYWSANGSYTIGGTQSIKTGRTISGWTNYEHIITGQTSSSVSGNGNIDELRLFPINAQMSTYTYDPLVGMISECDPNNKITYYEYDAFRRLSVVRDQDKNILKKICYGFADSVIPCN